MPSRCIFFFNTLRAWSTLLSRTNICEFCSSHGAEGAAGSTKMLPSFPKSCALQLGLHAPELKSAIADSLLDLVARKQVGRVFAGSNHAERMPGTELVRQLGAQRIIRERSQFLFSGRLSKKNPA